MKKVKIILTTVILCAAQLLSAQDGKEMIGQVYEYDKILDFFYDCFDDEPTFQGEEPLAIVKYEGKYGVINRANEVVIPIIYKELGERCQGLFSVKLDKKYGFINTKGELVIDYKYDDLLYGFGGAQGYKDDQCAVKYKRKWGVINTKGKIIRKFKYVDVWDVPATRKMN